MGSYNVEFSGKLLAGFDPREVRVHAAARLRMNDAQLDRVFNGQPVVLKKAVDEAVGQRYLGELHRLGMASRLIKLDAAPPAAPSRTFKVVFIGRLADGFAREAVAVAAARRLNIGPTQVERLFSGKKVVLKRGVSARLGQRYVEELAAIGMLTQLIDEAVEGEAAPSTVSEPPKPVTPPPVMTPPAPALITPVGKVAGAVPELEDVAGHTPADLTESQLAAFTATQFEMPHNMLATGDVPEPMQDSLHHAATLLVDPARLVEQMMYQAPSAPEPVAPPVFPGVTMPAAPAIDTESTVAYVKCDTCGHRQPMVERCRRCGAELRDETGLVAASAVQVVAQPELVAAPVLAQDATQLALEPIVLARKVEDEEGGEAAADVVAPHASDAEGEGLPEERLPTTVAVPYYGPDPATVRKRKLIIAAVVIVILLLYFMRG